MLERFLVLCWIKSPLQVLLCQSSASYKCGGRVGGKSGKKNSFLTSCFIHKAFLAAAFWRGGGGGGGGELTGFVVNLFGFCPHREDMKSGVPDACRVHGSLEVSKVAGNFHITAGKWVSLLCLGWVGRGFLAANHQCSLSRSEPCK